MPPLKDGLKLGGSLLRLPNESWRPILTMGAVTPAKALVLNGLGEASALLCATMIGRPIDQCSDDAVHNQCVDVALRTRAVANTMSM